MRRPQRQNITGQVRSNKADQPPRHKQTGKRRSRAGQPPPGVFSVNYFCRRIASPENVTEILALISNPNQD